MKWTETERVAARVFARRLEARGFTFFSGVPCSLLGALLEELSRKKGRYLTAVREDAAIAAASGAWLAGKRSAVLMQNSGIGYSPNVLTSFNLIYRVPVLLVVSWRGHGPDAPEHAVMGRSCVRLLREVGVPCFLPGKNGLSRALSQASHVLEKERIPAAILIERGVFGA